MCRLGSHRPREGGVGELLADVFDADRSLDASGLCAGLMVGYLAGVGLGVMVDFVFFFGQGHHLITSL